MNDIVTARISMRTETNGIEVRMIIPNTKKRNTTAIGMTNTTTTMVKKTIIVNRRNMNASELYTQGSC